MVELVSDIERIEAQRTATVSRRLVVATDAGRRRRRSAPARARRALVHLMLSTLVLVGLFPYAFMILTSFKDNDQYYASVWAWPAPAHWENYSRAWQMISPFFVNSIVVSALALVGTLSLSMVAAFVLARYQFRGRSVVFALVALMMMVPGVAGLIPRIVLMREFGLLDTLVVLAIPHIVGGAILGTIILRTFVLQLPASLFEAAEIDGASAPRTFWQLVIPLTLPPVGSIAIVTLLGVWNDFFWPLLAVSSNELKTISVGLLFFRGQTGTEYGPMFAGYVLASIPLIVVFTTLSKYFLAGIQGGVPDGK